MAVERRWQWLRQQLTALHCHRDEDKLRDRIYGFQAQLNDEPTSFTAAYAPRLAWIPRKRSFGFERGRGLVP